LNDLELTTFDEKKEFVPRHILYKDGTRKHIASEIGKKLVSKINGGNKLHFKLTRYFIKINRSRCTNSIGFLTASDKIYAPGM
jgi:hypothetical protein